MDCAFSLNLHYQTHQSLYPVQNASYQSSCDYTFITDFYFVLIFILNAIFHFSIFTYSIKTLKPAVHVQYFCVQYIDHYSSWCPIHCHIMHIQRIYCGMRRSCTIYWKATCTMHTENIICEYLNLLSLVFNSKHFEIYWCNDNILWSVSFIEHCSQSIDHPHLQGQYIARVA